MKTGIFYASSTGTTRDVASRIASALGLDKDDIHDVSKTAPSRLGDYDLIIVGSSTYGAGDLDDHMYDFVDGAQSLELKGKKIAVFGCGDQTMSSTFCDAVGTLYEALRRTEATMVGAFDTFPYEFDHSKAVPVQGAEAVGLLIDQVNHPEATDERIRRWVSRIV